MIFIGNDIIHELQYRIHGSNREAGWWDKPRSIETLGALAISEIGEATNGRRKNLLDDHLPQYPMEVVEIVDLLIRVMDTAVHNIIQMDKDISQILFMQEFNLDSPLDTHYELVLLTVEFYNALKNGKHGGREYTKVLALGLYYITILGYDPLEIIEAKLEYNKTRADHKRENREKEGGKKW